MRSGYYGKYFIDVEEREKQILKATMEATRSAMPIN